MNFILKPSLENIAVVKLTTMLWNQPDIVNLMSRFFHPYYISTEIAEWLKIEDSVKEKVQQLPIPECLKVKVSGFIKPIGYQILKWIEYNHRIFLHIDLPQEFSWTSHGTIDKRRTAELLVKNENIDIVSRFKLSCIYCLENAVREVWAQMDEDTQKSLDYEDEHELTVFWICYIKGELAKMEKMVKRTRIEKLSFVIIYLNYKCTPYQYAFEYAADDGNATAVEYFYHKLTLKEKEESLTRIGASVAEKCSEYKPEFMRQNYSDILCFLLSKMDHEQKMELFKNFSRQVLICLLDWPWQIFFLEAASVVWNFLSSIEYHVLLNNIIGKVRNGHKYFNYHEMFAKTWQESPDAYKRDIKLMFSDATIQEKRRILCNPNGQDIWKYLIEAEEWDLLKHCIRECITSKQEMIKFKYGVEENISRYPPEDELGKEKNVKYQQMIDDMINDFDKRKLDEESNLNGNKRFCSS